MRIVILIAGIAGLSVLVACSSDDPKQVDACAGHPEPSASAYRLPFPAGTAFRVVQENCAPPKAPWTHFGRMRFAYDFAMPIGSPVVAARSGVVILARDVFGDDDHDQNHGNAVVVRHDDGTVALYGHLTRNGALAAVGARVAAGEVIARSGNSGQSPIPHLHFQVQACADFANCDSLPVSFHNAVPANRRFDRDARVAARTP